MKPDKRGRNMMQLSNNKTSDTGQPSHCTADRGSAALAILSLNPLILDDGRRLTFTDRDTRCPARDAGNCTVRRGDGAGQRSACVACDKISPGTSG